MCGVQLTHYDRLQLRKSCMAWVQLQVPVGVLLIPTDDRADKDEAHCSRLEAEIKRHPRGGK